MLIIRPMQAHEWEMYRQLRLAALREAPDAFGSTLAREQAFTEEEWITRLAEASVSELDQPLVAEDDGRAVGLCWVRIDPNDSSTAALYQVWVHPDARRRGVGEGLLQAAMRWAHAAGARTMMLTVSLGRNSAVQLYKRAGFIDVGMPSPLREDSGLLQQAMECTLGVTLDAAGTEQ
ncbi:MAG: GNAT family N-acetyltransferase [Gemmatimonadota bacterium]|nr:GNAT family N-acetyltransferase [Gemmatimonadota bacterium]